MLKLVILVCLMRIYLILVENLALSASARFIKYNAYIDKIA